jgi:antitoxin component of MazEF toxin-antitoxin module
MKPTTVLVERMNGEDDTLFVMIPEEMMKALNIEGDDIVTFTVNEKNQIVISKA